jgi:haloalkane dehalogenase
MDIIRTPDERFANLTGYPFTPHYVEADGLRIHYVDEGPRNAPPVLLLHGEPAWSYMYRETIAALAAAGHRVIAPDLPGFGRSDKPVDRGDYTYERHVGWMRALVTALDLREITLVAHDWGGFIGLRLVAESPDLFARVAVSDTDLRTGDEPMPEEMRQWRTFSQELPVFQVGEIIQIGTVTTVPEDVRAGYDAPYPDDRYQAGARQFPMLIPISPDDPATAANRAAWEVLRGWDKPFLTIYGDESVLSDANARFQELVPGAKGQPHRLFHTGHFLPEDIGAELAEVLLDFLSR